MNLNAFYFYTIDEIIFCFVFCFFNEKFFNEKHCKFDFSRKWTIVRYIKDSYLYTGYFFGWWNWYISKLNFVRSWMGCRIWNSDTFISWNTFKYFRRMYFPLFQRKYIAKSLEHEISATQYRMKKKFFF